MGFESRFGRRAGALIDEESGEVILLQRKGKLYVLKCWLKAAPFGRPESDDMEEAPQCVSYSISRIDGIGASPLFGTASAALDKEVDTTEIDGDAPPLEVADHDESKLADVPGGVGEEEVRKP